MARLENRGESLTELKNIAYQEIREPYAIGPVAGMYADRLKIDTPLLWKDSIAVARRLPVGRRTEKQVIFGVLDTYGSIAKIPYSSDASWDDKLENLRSGVWEELIDYVTEWSPWPVNADYLRSQYLSEPAPDQKSRYYGAITARLKKNLLDSEFGRRLAFKFWGGRAGTSMSQRLLTRLAIASSLNQELHN